uniref:Odorant-binding protein 31 n=1 Tax=Pyrrhalta aenescens TaxID=281545 RepID=A0A1J0KKN1_9CUCU|nr:odorant-binding protein 31 [Pyrrhalta aenescens]
MKAAIILALCLAIAHCLVDVEELGEEFVEKAKHLHDVCVAQTQVPNSVINLYKAGIFPVQNNLLKKYLTCLWLESKGANRNLEFNDEVIKNFFPASIAAHLVPIYVGCAKLVKQSAPMSTPIDDKFYLISNCIYFKDPENWVFF